MAIKKQAVQGIGFLRTTAIGGVFFLLPLVIIGSFLGKFVQVSFSIAKSLENVFPLQAIGGIATVLLTGAAVLIGLCFFAGLIAKRSFARRFTETLEKQLQIAFPRYAIVKDRLSGNIGGESHRSELKSVLVRGHDGCFRLGLEVERGSGELVTVYFPNSPDPWSGQIALVPQQMIQPLNVDFMEAMTTFEKLGRDFQKVSNCNELNRS